MDEIDQLKQRISYLENTLLYLVKTDKYTIHKDLYIADGRDIIIGKSGNSQSVGMKIGTATDQKLGFFNATPVDQPATVSDASGCAGDADDKVNLVIDRLQELGLIA